MADSPDLSGVHLWLVLMKAHRAIYHHALESIESTGLCFSDFAILEALLHKGPQPVNTLAMRVGLTSGSGTTAIDRLAARGYVARQADAGDRRARVVHLTASGRAAITKAFERHAAEMEEAAGQLTPSERAALVGLLKKYGKPAEPSSSAGNTAVKPIPRGSRPALR